MDILHAVILGIVEGLTEFLPISSTFHLIFSSRLLGLEQTEFLKMFEVVIQSGAILAVVLIYGQELLKNKTRLIQLGFSFVPTAVVGLLMYKVIKEDFFENINLMVGVFIAMAFVFFIVEFLVRAKKLVLETEIQDMSLIQAFVIGLIQAAAVVPGVSRAGSVIIGMMLMGFTRSEAAKYSFLLAIPTILAASALDIVQSSDVLFSSSENMMLLLVGFTVAFGSAYICIKWFIRYVQKHTLTFFGFYRIVLGIIILLLLRGAL
ncbi:MAG: undecaprenyl-diphosphate phosphatase [Weeksellaceae bacterium]